ncbi:MAG: hypothetical protein AMXMBFR84_10580 [Candidatus Hydrogenedentota bacterium]
MAAGAGGELNPKYPGGIPALTQLLESEGHLVVQRGKRFFVADYEMRLADLEGRAGSSAILPSRDPLVHSDHRGARGTSWPAWSMK